MELLNRYLRVRIVSAEPEATLSRLLLSDLELMDITLLDLLTVEVRISKNQFPFMKRILEKNGISYHVVKKEGVLWRLQNVRRRPVLVAGIIIFLLASFVLPGRIFFINVTGNDTIPTKLILTQAQQCGIAFGTKSAEVRSENVKNQLLGRLPQLQWVGVTTEGTVATIHVKQRSEPEQVPSQSNGVSHIVAARDGVITQMTVFRGNPLCAVGQSVKAGDLLVSGYTDCGIMLKAENAQAEVFGYTMRKNQFVSPAPAAYRENYTGKHTCFQLRVGKKVINLCNHSGISDTSCVKMYAEEDLTLPGGFVLPVSIIKVNHLYYNLEKEKKENKETYAWLPQFAKAYLKEHMIAGEILSRKLRWELTDTGCVLTGKFDCHEVIGQVKYEEIMAQDAEDHGTNCQR